MRNELEYLAEIENYLINPNSDKMAFEKRMQQDAALQQDTQLIQGLISAVQAQGIRQEIKRAKTNHSLTKALKFLSITLVVLTAVLAAAIIYNNTLGGKSEIEIRTELPTTNELGGTEWTQADSVLPYLIYNLSGDKDEVVETPEGIIFSIPKGSFVDKNGNPVTGEFELEIKEAMNPADIMKAGLSTWSDDKLLETGGMFYINARKDGENLQIAKDANITSSVPKLQDRNDMMLFDGERTNIRWEDGEKDKQADSTAYSYIKGSEINWINPRKPISDLISVPMDLLNFYPPNFEKTLDDAGYPNKSKAFKDSVYLSFMSMFKNAIYRENLLDDSDYDFLGDTAISINVEKIKEQFFVRNPGWDESFFSNNKNTPFWVSKSMGIYGGINPSSVLAFWNKEFNQTILATREFEKRMREIHGTCNEEILNCYTKNIDKPLYYCDSLATTKSYGEEQIRFQKYYSEGLGKPADAKKITQALLNVFALKQRELDAAYNRTTGEWFKKQAKADEQAFKNELKQTDRNSNRDNHNFDDEFNNNLCSANTQLGKPCKKKFYKNVRENYNTFHIATTGWKNVDAYIFEATTNRSSMNYTDPQSGKTATLTYTDLSVTVSNVSNFDIVETYLIPSGKMSFMRLKKQDGKFTESLNSLYQYHLVCMGYKGKEVSLFTQENITGGDINITLKSSTIGEVNRFISRNASQRASDDLSAELKYLDFKIDEIKRNAERLKVEQLREVLLPIVFPCSGPMAREEAIDSPVVSQTK